MSFLTSGKIAQQVGVLAGAASASGTTINGAWVDASLAPQIAVAVTANQNVSIQWQHATDGSGTGATNIGDPVAPEAVFGTAEINPSSLPDGATHVRAVITLAESGAGGCVYMLGNQRQT